MSSASDNAPPPLAAEPRRAPSEPAPRPSGPRNDREPRGPGRRGPVARIARAALFAVGGLALLGAAGVAGAIAWVNRDLPDFSQLAAYEPPVTTRLYAADGSLIAEYATENRLYVPISAIPQRVVQAFVSAEDQNFFHHPGVDLQGIARIMIVNLRNAATGRRLEGASTITQQVARNFFLTNEMSVERKLKEMLLALKIERTYDKSRILELYLNQIYLGRGAYGVAAASLAYFNKPLAELTLPEIAYLAAVPKAPNNYNPVTRHDAAVARRNYVIDRMAEDGVIQEEVAERAKSEPLVVQDRAATEFAHADHFAEEVRRHLQRLYGSDQLYEGGLSVRTTLDPRLQAIADRALRDGLVAYDRRHGWRGPVGRLEGLEGWQQALAEVERPDGALDWRIAVVLEVEDDRAGIGLDDGSTGTIPFADAEWARPWSEGQGVGPAPRRMGDIVERGDVVLVEPVGDAAGATFALRQIPDVEGALVALDPNTGRVLALSGGWSFAESEFNRATQAQRQPGSTFKPFVYLAALEQGFTPSTIVPDTPVAIDTGDADQIWKPDNASGDFLGAVAMRVGVERSRNLMTVRILTQIGLEPVRDVAARFGVYQDMPLLYSSALGALETTPIAMTRAFAMVANGGHWIEPSFIDRIQDRTGATVYRADSRPCDGCATPGPAGGEPSVPVIPDTRDLVADPVAVYQLASMLEGVVQRGTASSLRSLGIPLAGKTGTTNDVKDAWFVGFSSDLAVGVFVGFDEPKPLGSGESGTATAVPIFRAFMAEALEGREPGPLRPPPDVALVAVDPVTGEPSSAPDAVMEAFRPGTEPAAGDTGSTPFGESLPEATTGTGGLY